MVPKVAEIDSPQISSWNSETVRLGGTLIEYSVVYGSGVRDLEPKVERRQKETVFRQV